LRGAKLISEPTMRKLILVSLIVSAVALSTTPAFAPRGPNWIKGDNRKLGPTIDEPPDPCRTFKRHDEHERCVTRQLNLSLERTRPGNHQEGTVPKTGGW
jgi:hypothetical protein